MRRWMPIMEISRTLAALVIAFPAVLGAQDTPYVHEGRYVTPHYKWADPQEGAPLRTLAIVPANGSRDVWDLSQRMPLAHTVFEVNAARGKFGQPEMFGSSAEWVGGLSEYEHRRKALAALLDANAYDLIILGNVCWSSLPLNIVYKISEQVRRGAGVVMTNARFGDPLIEKLYTQTPLGDGLDLFQPFPFDALEKAATWKKGSDPVTLLDRTEPYGLPRGAMTAWQVGRGRCVSLAFPESRWESWSGAPALIPGCDINMRNLVQEDYYYALVAKACRWAAGRAPSARLVAIAPQGEARPAGTPLGVSLHIAPGADDRPFRGEAAVDVRDAVTGRLIGSVTAPVTAEPGGTNLFALAIGDAEAPGRPLLLHADAFIHVRLLNRGRVTDFGVGFVRAVPVARPVMALDAPILSYPDPVSGTLTFNPAGQAESVTLELYDAQGRIWERTRLAVTGAAVPFKLPTARTRGLAHGIRAAAFRGDLPVGTSDAFFTLRRPRESYYFHVSDEPWGTWHSLRRIGRAYEWGMDGLRDHKPCVPDALMTALAGVDLNPGRPHVTLPLALDPEQVRQLEETGRTNSTLYRGFNQAIYNTSDDCGPRVGQISPASMPRFTAWLQSRYTNDITRLNAVWQTGFASFGAIDLPTVRGAKEQGRVEIWMDYCLFVNDVYLEAQRRYRQAIQAVDPRPATGCDAVYYGHSLASLFRELGYIMPYYTPVAVEMGRTLAKKGPPPYTGICMGYGTDSPRPFHEYLPWHILFAGNNSTLFWSLSAGFNGDLVKADTIRYKPGWMMGEAGRIKLSGAGMFINACARRPSGIAILYSEASKRAEDIDAPFNRVEDSALNFQELLQDQGLAFDYVSSDSILKDGALADETLKLLVLPHAQALAVEEADRIRQFVDRGGTVLADVRPGIRNGHGTRLEHGLLDDLFGIARTNAPAAEVPVTFPGASVTVAGRADPGVILRGAVPKLQSTGIPLFLEHRVGRGRALLMNVEAAFLGVSPRGDAESATSAREAGPALAAYPFVSRVLESVGIEPPYRARLNDAAPLGVKLTPFSRGGTRLLAVEVKPVGGIRYPGTLEVDVGAGRHVVEIRSGKDFGRTAVIRCPVNPYDVLLFALISERPGDLKITVPGRIQAGDSLRVSVRRPRAPGESLLHFALTRPDGVLLRDYQERVLTDGGEVHCAIPLPFNCPVGKWRLTVTDLVTQRTASTAVTVERRLAP